MERFFEEVRDNLSDPHTSSRLTKAKMIRDLHAADRDIFEQLLKINLQESNLGYAECTISIVAGQEFYLLPPGFRQFYEMIQYQDGVPIDAISSKSHFQSRWGAEILSGDRGFRLKPPLQTASDWTLSYSRAPGQLHYAKALAVSANSITCGTPLDGAGEVVELDDYYNGMDVRIFKADSGVLQQRVIQTTKIVNGEVVLFLRNAFDPVPSGDVWYEVCPTIPDPYDSLYAMDVALLNIGRRSRPERFTDLALQRQKKWDSVKSYYQSNVSDRAPERILPLRGVDRMSSEIPYPYLG